MIVFSFNKPDGQVQLHLERVLARRLAAPVRLARPERCGGDQPRDRHLWRRSSRRSSGTMIGLALTRYQFRGRGLLNGLIFLPMATPEIVLGASLLTLFVATALPPLAGRRPDALPDRLPHDPHRPHHVQHQLRGRDREGATGGLRSAARGGRDGPRRERGHDVLEGDVPAHPARASWPRRCSRSACRSTTSSSRTSSRERPTRSRSGSTRIQRNALPVQINVIGSIVFLGAVGLVALTTLRSGRAPRLR